MIEEIVSRVLRRMSDNVVRETGRPFVFGEPPSA
jgi:hypothetical protein